MTVCNLNRVNCHNAFVAMYELKLALANTSLSAEEKVRRERCCCYCPV